MNALSYDGPVMWVAAMDVFLSHWFPRYEDARAFMAAEGGFLFPFEHQFFAASSEAVRALGLDPADADWPRIGFDWIQPADPKAWARLRLQREIAA